MKIEPKRIDDLSPKERSAVMERSMEDISSVYEDVRKIVEDIRNRGDAVALEHYKKHKGDIAPSDLEITTDEIKDAYNQLDPEVVECLKTASQNIIKFHKAQIERGMWSIEVSEGILAGRITRPMDIVGCYIPGGRATYPSSILMTVLPAKVAGVGTVVAVTPPSKGMVANPATLVAADLCLALGDSLFPALGGAALWGIHMGLTQGLFAKLVADVTPEDFLGSAFGIFNLVSGVSVLMASLIAGTLWSTYGAPVTFFTGAAFASLALFGLLIYIRAMPVTKVK